MPQQKIPLMQMLTWRESTTPRETRETRERGKTKRAGTRGNAGYSERVASILEMGKGERQPPMALPQHSHCLGRHLRITLVVPCVKYRLWSVAVTVCYETDTHAYC